MRKKLSVEKPELLDEWDYEQNEGLDPDNFTGGSERKVWWKCKLGHIWVAAINSRVMRGTNCPCCAGKKVWVGFNDLQATNPVLAKEWDYEQNEGRKPTEFTKSSNKIFWWKCKLGHSWPSSINNRDSGNGCPYCSGKKVLVGFNDLKTVNPILASEWDSEKNDELLPEHFTAGSKAKVWWICGHGHAWQAVISSRSSGKRCPYCTGKQHLPGVGDLQSINPTLAKEWDYEKNKMLRPGEIAPNDPRKVWWRCKLGHGWEARVSNRNNGNGCPYCSNHLVLKGFNDLLYVDPALCKQWDYDKNVHIQPDEIVAGSDKKAYWKCDKGHSFKSRIVDRRKGSGCPVCASKIIIPGQNDLKTLRPEIAAQWDHEKNGDLRPERIPVQSTKRVWWLCEFNHSYEAVVYNRYYGTGCPYCSGNLPLVGETDFATVHPELCAQWDYTKNKEKIPEDYTASSNKKIWWKCEQGHSWKTAICDRHNGSNCPYCSGKLAVEGETDVATLFPELINEWDHDRNEEFTLRRMRPKSSKKFWWKCSRGHHWLASIQSRTTGNSCPRCRGKTPMRMRLVK